MTVEGQAATCHVAESDIAHALLRKSHDRIHFSSEKRGLVTMIGCLRLCMPIVVWEKLHRGYWRSAFLAPLGTFWRHLADCDRVSSDPVQFVEQDTGFIFRTPQHAMTLLACHSGSWCVLPSLSLPINSAMYGS